jgi:hypothetical protein
VCLKPLCVLLLLEKVSLISCYCCCCYC